MGLKKYFDFNQVKWLKIFKIAIGSSLSIMIAELLGLENATSAGIITLLTIQNTKKETFTLALKRAISLVVTILLCLIFFYQGIHFHLLAFAVLLLVLIGFSELFGWQAALSVNVVIATHFLIKASFTPLFIVNEMMLLITGVGIAIILNLYIPKLNRAIQKDIGFVEEEFKDLLEKMAQYILQIDKSEEDTIRLSLLSQHLEEALGRSFENMNNTFYSHAKYYIEYMEMRKSQLAILTDIHQSIHSLNFVPVQAKVISKFIKEIAATLHQYNNVTHLRKDLEEIFTHMKEQPLPKTRTEFENRAVLYHILKEFDEFLLLKYEFVESLTDQQRHIYWADS